MGEKSFFLLHRANKLHRKLFKVVLLQRKLFALIEPVIRLDFFALLIYTYIQ